MSHDMKKMAGMESGKLSDSRTGLEINVSTTVRCKYRLYYGGNPCRSDEGGRSRGVDREDYETISNEQLNEMIAQDFAASSANVVHMFLSNSSSVSTKKRVWIEIRKVSTSRPFNFFFSVVRGDSIDIISVNTRYKTPRKPRVFDVDGRKAT